MSHRIPARCLPVVASFALAIAFAGALSAQGFGKIRKTITLERKLPAAVHLTGTAYNVKVTAGSPQFKDLADRLQQVVETELVKYDTRLTVDTQKPDTVITLRITNFNVPPAIAVRNTTPRMTLGSRRNVLTPTATTAYKISGTLSASYQVKTRAGKFLDADNITAKYSGEFDEQGSKVSKGWDMVKKPLSRLRHLGKSEETDEDSAPRTAGDVEHALLTKTAALVAARLVNTDEKVTVRLARGDLDEYNKYADAGQWTRMQEALETSKPFPDKEDDAYRLYNIGVTYEALGYGAENAAAAKKYLEQAAIDYGKAIDANPRERYFLEPQNRIETALAHYKKISVNGGNSVTRRAKSK